MLKNLKPPGEHAHPPVKTMEIDGVLIMEDGGHNVCSLWRHHHYREHPDSE